MDIKKYLSIMVIQMIPYALVQAYSSSLRERGETILPMISGLAAVVVNMALNYVLIFGKLGLPRLGVAGAAIATVSARFVELAVVVLWTHLRQKHKCFTKGLYTSFKISSTLTKRILIIGTPLMLNEAMWAGGMAVIISGYSVRGLDTVAAFNISTTLSNLFNIVFIAMGNAIAIIIGQLLGGKTLITFLFDSVFVWVVSIPLCFILTKLTSLPITIIYFLVQASEILKCIIGYILVKKGVWINNLTE